MWSRILSFLGWVLAHAADKVHPMLARLLEGRSGLLRRHRRRLLRRPLRPPAADRSTDLYADLCDLLFHGQGRLHVAYLTDGRGRAAPTRSG